jgi:hypothetical protein
MVQETAQAFRIPTRTAEPLVFEALWTTHLPGARYYSSPLLVDHLIYATARKQLLTVLDAKTGARVYTEELDVGMGVSNSVYTSPAQAGPYVFVSGFGGKSVVLRSGTRFQQVASNELEKFRGSPVFDGKRMFIRGYRKLYCISGPSAPAESAERGSTP